MGGVRKVRRGRPCAAHSLTEHKPGQAGRPRSVSTWVPQPRGPSGCSVSRWSRELPVVPRLTCRCSDTPRPLADRSTSGTSGQVGLAGAWPVGGVGWAEQSQAGSGARTLRSLRRDETAGRLTYRNGSRASAGRERVWAAGELRVLALPGKTTPGEEPAQSFSPFPALKSWGAGAMATQRKWARPRPPSLPSVSVFTAGWVWEGCVCARAWADGRGLCP